MDNGELAECCDSTASHGECDRRVFLKGAMAVGAAAFAGGAIPAVAARRTTVSRNPLNIPPTATPTNFSIQAAPSTVNLGGGKLSKVWAYNGFFPGPTFRASRNDIATVQLANGLAEETTIHWHGMLVPPQADGHPRDAVMSGGTYNYQFLINQRACLNWYHPHPHMMTGEQVCLGLAGAFIINDTEEAALNLPAGGYEVPLIVRDASVDRAGNLVYNAKSSGFLGQFPLVNGTRDARFGVDSALYRFRVLNGANARVFRLALSSGAAFTLIGNDGGLLSSGASIMEFEYGPGERLDLLVDFRGLANGTKIMLRDLNAGWDLVEFEVTRQFNPGYTIPTGTLSAITSLSAPVRTRVFSFDGMSRINGLVYDINRIDFQIPFGQTELWRFQTGGNAPHPVHVHGASFQVISRTGGRGRLFPWEAGWKDTVLLQDGETVDVLIRFDAHRGLYLMHCHKLEHEDMGMMSNFEVI